MDICRVGGREYSRLPGGGMMNNDRSRGAEGVLEMVMYDDDIDICFFL